MERRSFFGSIIAGLAALFSPQGWLKQRGIRARRVQLPLFVVIESPTFRLTDIKERRFNMIERMESPSPPV